MINEKKLNLKFSIFDNILVFLTVFFRYLVAYRDNFKVNNLSFSSNILYLYLIILIAFVIIDIVNKKIYKIELGKIVIFGTIASYFIVFYSEQNFLITYLLALISLKKDNKEFIKSFFISSLICYILTLTLNFVGILPDYNMIRIVNNSYNQRLSLGFSHPNNVFLFWLPIVLSGYYLFYNNKLYYFVTIITSFILYKLSYCRTGFYEVIIFLCLSFLYRKLKLKTLKKSTSILFILLTILSIFLAYKFGYSYSNNISEALSGRPYYWNYYLKSGKMFTLFGNNRVEGMHIDNFYIYMLVQLGIIGYLIYFLIYYLSVKNLKNDYRYLVIIIMFFVYGLFEANVIIGSIQFMFVLQLKSLISIENKIKPNEK